MDNTNLRVLHPSRARRRAGDIFVAQVRDGELLFARLISTAAEVFSGVSCNLLYVYQDTSTSESELPALSKERLLIAPQLLNQKPWTLGYLKRVGHEILGEDDVLSKHRFRDVSGRLRDEKGTEVGDPAEPCGQFGVGNHRTLDDAISEALGIELALD